MIKKVASGEKRIGGLFTEEQIYFPLGVANRRHPDSELAALGPIEASRWNLAEPVLPWLMTVEPRRRSDGEQNMEISAKAPAVQATVNYFGFMAFLAEVGTERDPNQQAKTRRALDFFAAEARRPAQTRSRAKARAAGTRVSKSGRSAGRGASRGR